MADDPRQRARENLTAIVSMLVTGLWLAAFFTGQEWWLALLLVGYVVIVPLVALLFGDEEDRAEWWDDSWSDDWSWTGETTDTESEREREPEPAADADSDDDALATLRERYARGELTDEQFERKLERLLETETLEDAEDRAQRARADDATEYETDRSR